MKRLDVEVSDEVADWLARVGATTQRTAERQAARVLEEVWRLGVPNVGQPEGDEVDGHNASGWQETGLCLGCGYSRIGLPTGRACPECGRLPSPMRSPRPCPECGLSMVGRQDCVACGFRSEPEELFLWEFADGIMPVEPQKRRQLRIAPRGYSIRRGIGRPSWTAWKPNDKVMTTRRGLRVDRRVGSIPIIARFEFQIPDPMRAEALADKVLSYIELHR